MKTNFFALLFFFSGVQAFAEDTTKPTLAVISLDVVGLPLDDFSAGNIARREIEKLDRYDVFDRYDVAYLIEKNKLNTVNCFGKTCLVEAGKGINADKMFSGTIERYTEKIIFTLRLIDVKSNTIEKTYVHEFLNLPERIDDMTAISERAMFGFDNDKALVDGLTKVATFDSKINSPNSDRLRLDGPRMGFTVLTGENASIFQASESNGGYDGFPVMFQFGYQFESQYLNAGNFQALFEFIPMITGLDQGLFIPSMTIMHGLRSNKSGWEFAFGPAVALTHKAHGYYEPDLGWQLESQWLDSTVVNPYPIVTRMDSRGSLALTSGFVFAFGKSIRSGKLNIPFNAYIIPQRDGWRFGLSFGFNAKASNN
jgi:hypothetical protein